MLVLFKPVEQNGVKNMYQKKVFKKNELGTTIQYICGYRGGATKLRKWPS